MKKSFKKKFVKIVKWIFIIIGIFAFLKFTLNKLGGENR